MKSKKTGNMLVLMLNKKSIANLNHREMFTAKGKSEDESQGVPAEQETDPIVCEMTGFPVPTDFGIPTRIS